MSLSPRSGRTSHKWSHLSDQQTDSPLDRSKDDGSRHLLLACGCRAVNVLCWKQMRALCILTTTARSYCDKQAVCRGLRADQIERRVCGFEQRSACDQRESAHSVRKQMGATHKLPFHIALRISRSVSVCVADSVAGSALCEQAKQASKMASIFVEVVECLMVL